MVSFVHRIFHSNSDYLFEMVSRPGHAPVVQPSSGNAIIVNSCQRLNPLLEAIRNVPKEFGDIVPDFEVGRTTGVLFLSLKYHRLHPEYIHQRIEKLGHRYDLRILLVVCDISEHQDPIRELTKICLINNITVIVSWTIDEAALYLTTYKQYEHKPPDTIKERIDKDYASILRSALTSIKSINKTDVETLRSNCGSFAGISRASEQTLLDLPGFAQTKVRRVQDAFHKPFHPKAATASPFRSAGKQPSSQSAASTAKEAEAPPHANEPQVLPAVPPPPPSHPPIAPPRPPRSPSPVWDIELDLNDPSLHDRLAEVEEEAGVSLGSNVVHAERIAPPADSPPARPRPARSPSPVWDIELDLNVSPSPSPPPDASDGPPARKKAKVDSLFGKPENILSSA